MVICVGGLCTVTEERLLLVPDEDELEGVDLFLEFDVLAAFCTTKTGRCPSVGFLPELAFEGGTFSFDPLELDELLEDILIVLYFPKYCSIIT